MMVSPPFTPPPLPKRRTRMGEDMGAQKGLGLLQSNDFC